jgi:BirA family biotin operon repressor/biotin-[acetyl-CoA-carboxylase] ligase
MVENRLKNIAQRLRRNPTDAEKALWARLKGRQLGVAFTRQCPIGGYVVDFACHKARLALEIDGGHHADSADDSVRTRRIESHGYRLIRFWNNEVLENPDGVIQAIIAELANARNQT